MMGEDGAIHCESPEEMDRRIREYLAEERGCSVEEVWPDDDDLPDLDPDLETVPADEFYDDE